MIHCSTIMEYLILRYDISKEATSFVMIWNKRPRQNVIWGIQGLNIKIGNSKLRSQLWCRHRWYTTTCNVITRTYTDQVKHDVDGTKHEWIFHFLQRNNYYYPNGNSQPVIIDLPVSQWTPVKPTVQEQLYPFTASVQFAPFWHGALRHSSISVKLHHGVMILERLTHYCDIFSL